MHAQCPPMGRRRTRDFDLPPRLYRRGDSYYYVTHERRWIPLGKDLVRAKRLWADYECAPLANTVTALVVRYLSDHTDDLAESTRKSYTRYAKTIDREWGATPLDQLEAWHLAQWRDRRGTAKVAANTVISLLRVAYDKAVEWGWCRTNPARGVALNETAVRDRLLSDEEYRAIRMQSPRWLQVAMDIGYATAARPCDIVSLRWDKVTDVLAVRQKKTKKRQVFVLAPEVEAILREARARPILGLYVVATDKGRPIKQRRLQKAWRSACAAAGVVGAQFRDIRAKSATDAEAEGLDYQALLGHTTRAMSDRYLKAKRTQLVQPLRRKL